MWLEERRVNHVGRVSVGPIVEGLERQGKRSGLDSLSQWGAIDGSCEKT